MKLFYDLSIIDFNGIPVLSKNSNNDKLKNNANNGNIVTNNGKYYISTAINDGSWCGTLLNDDNTNYGYKEILFRFKTNKSEGYTNTGCGLIFAKDQSVFSDFKSYGTDSYYISVGDTSTNYLNLVNTSGSSQIFENQYSSLETTSTPTDTFRYIKIRLSSNGTKIKSWYEGNNEPSYQIESNITLLNYYFGPLIFCYKNKTTTLDYIILSCDEDLVDYKKIFNELIVNVTDSNKLPLQNINVSFYHYNSKVLLGNGITDKNGRCVLDTTLNISDKCYATIYNNNDEFSPISTGIIFPKKKEQ